jgi:serine phosphatase RsbU (regulator of sigma subunit)
VQAEKTPPAVSKPDEDQYVSKRISRLKSINYIYKKVSGLNDKCKQLVSTPSGILVSTNKGLYVITDHSAKVVVENRYINFIGNLTEDNRHYIADNEGYFYITPQSGRWRIIYPDQSFREPLYSITRGYDSLLWAGGNSVVYRIPEKRGVSSSDVKAYSVDNSYPQKYIVENFNDTIFLVAESGIYFFDQNSDSFLRYNGEDFQSESGTVYIYSQPDILWYKDADEWRFFSDDLNVIGNKAFLLNIFKDIAAISVTSDYVWVITADNGLHRYSRARDFSITPDTELFVKSVTNQDGNYFGISAIEFKRGDNTVYFDLVAPGYLKQNSVQYQYQLEKIMTDWSKWSYASTITLMPPPGEHTLKVRAKDIWGNISEPKTLNFTIKAPFTKTSFFYILIVVSFLTLIILIARFRVIQLRKEKSILEEKVRERTKEIQAQKEEITSSIEYASRIQMAMLPVEDVFKNNFSDQFIFFKPRDIVSGDFYWIGENARSLFFTVSDCTGHGVPGAFMSTLGISTLNEIITNKSNLNAGTVLNMLRDKIKASLHQTGKVGEAADGMDIAFCILHKDRKKLEYAGAYNPLIVFQNGVLKEYKADRMPIGIYYGEKDTFTNNEIKVEKGDTIYIYSDGFCDQFGGSNGTKYKSANLKKLLLEINMKPMDEQKKIIENEYIKWRGTYEQVDDITIVGVRI